MRFPRIKARASSVMSLLAAIVVAAAWMGCASSGDPGPGDPPAAPASNLKGKDAGAPTTANDRDPPGHPAFEAGFPDSSSADPTPDGGDVCIDKDDPGSTEATAKALPDTTAAQTSPITVKGVLSSPVDVDFYSIKASQALFHFLSADLQDATPSTELCVFAKCLNGTTNWKGCTQGVEKTSDIGDKGCCTAGPGRADPDWSCGGTFQYDDSAQFYIRIKETAGGSACLPYSFSYAF